MNHPSNPTDGQNVLTAIFPFYFFVCSFFPFSCKQKVTTSQGWWVKEQRCGKLLLPLALQRCPISLENNNGESGRGTILPPFSLACFQTSHRSCLSQTMLSKRDQSKEDQSVGGLPRIPLAPHSHCLWLNDS